MYTDCEGSKYPEFMKEEFHMSNWANEKVEQTVVTCKQWGKSDTKLRVLPLRNLNEVVTELAKLGTPQSLNLTLEGNGKGEFFLIVPEQDRDNARILNL